MQRITEKIAEELRKAEIVRLSLGTPAKKSGALKNFFTKQETKTTERNKPGSQEPRKGISNLNKAKQPSPYELGCLLIVVSISS
jgi:hypothetical protein